MKKIYSIVNRPIKTYEKLSGKSMVESAGYIPIKKKIENMIIAGKRLIENRAIMYDFYDDKVDFEERDRSRRKDYTKMDAIDDMKELKQRRIDRIYKQREAQKKALEAKKAEIKEKEAELEGDHSASK